MNSRSICYATLLQDAFWQVNKKLARHFKDNNTAIFLSDLMSRDRYWNERENYDGWFYVSQTEIEDECNISRKVQTRIVSDLVNDGVLDVVRRGVPCRNFYKIDYERVADILADNNMQDGTTSCDEKAQQDATLGHIQLLPEGATRSDIREQLYNKNKIKISNKNNNNKTLVVESNVPTKNDSKEIEYIFLYWKQVMGIKKAILDKKRQTFISKRLDDGYSIYDLKKAIDGCKASDFHMGKNDRNTKYNSIGLIFRDSDQVESFIVMADKKDTYGWASEAMQNYSRELNRKQKGMVNDEFGGSARLAGNGQSELDRSNVQ